MATLFGKVKTPTEKKQLMELLKFIVDGTRGGARCAVVPHALAQKVEKAEPGLIEPKAGAQADPVGNIAMTATAKGIAAIYPDAANAPAVAESPFVIEDGFAVPPSKRGGFAKTDTYPFAQMNVGQSFFVAATDEKPNPAKALASTVSSATKRYAAVYPEGHEKAGQATGKDGRKFTVRARTTEDGEKANGARVYRVA